MNVLEAIAKNPTTSFSRLPLLSEKERNTILLKWNDTAVNLLSDTTLHETFTRKRREKQSNATAIIFGNQTYCYADLNAAAESLSSYISGVCTKSEALIAILLERSPEFIISILAVLKSGCAYVPLDPAHYTDEHLINTMRQVGSQILVCRRSNTRSVQYSTNLFGRYT